MADRITAPPRKSSLYKPKTANYNLRDPPSPFSLSKSEQFTYLLALFKAARVLSTLRIAETNLVAFFRECSEGYVSTNPYHSFYHAIDVTQVTYNIIMNMNACLYLKNEDIAAILIAALCHDIAHPGYNNSYMINAKTELAERYSNVSVLEAYSKDVALELLDKHKILSHLSQVPNISPDEECQETNMAEVFKKTVVDAILATDMKHHFLLLEKLHAMFENITPGNTPMQSPRIKPFDNNNKQIHGNLLGIPSDKISMRMADGSECPLSFRRTLCNIILHAADISNAVRPWDINKHWSDLVNREFARQAELERKNGLPLSPGMDNYNDEGEASRLEKQCRLSVQFGEIIVKPLFTGLSEFLPPLQIFMEDLESNMIKWKEMGASYAEKAAAEAEAQAKQQSGDMAPEAVGHKVVAEKFKLIAARIIDGGYESLNALMEDGTDQRKLNFAAGSVEIPIDWRDRLRRRTYPNSNGYLRIAGTTRKIKILPTPLTIILPTKDNTSVVTMSPATMSTGAVSSQLLRAATNHRSDSDITTLLSFNAKKNAKDLVEAQILDINSRQDGKRRFRPISLDVQSPTWSSSDEDESLESRYKILEAVHEEEEESL